MVLGVNHDRKPKKRRLSRSLEEHLPDFFGFPPPSDGAQPFRKCIKEFLGRHARLTLPPSLFPTLMAWRIALRLDLSTVSVDVVEEDVTTSRRPVYCDHCRVVGWSGHPVCRKRYHFIIRADKGESKMSSDADAEAEADDEATIYQSNSCLDDNKHLLHAVVHSNGFGHLLTLNGREGGSPSLAGLHIMDFWDRLSESLSVRKVSVMDVSKKYGLEYRLLHAVSKGHSWYGDWGYHFGAGCYALTQDAYRKAVDTLSAFPLSPFLFHSRQPPTRLHAVISFYQSLSNTEFATFKDLFSCLLSLLRRMRSSDHPHSLASNILCAWTRNDVECLQQAMIKLLLASAAWVSRRALEGAMCKAASSELLDYSLKHLGGKASVNGFVRSRFNPSSTVVEYRLEPWTSMNSISDMDLNYPSKEQVICDLKFLYESLLHPNTMTIYKHQRMRDQVIDSATKLLDCKQFMKFYKPEKMTVEIPRAIQLWCHVQLADQPKGEPVIPPELVVLPHNATVADLKSAATQAFQEVYVMFKRFQAEKLVEYGSIADSFTLKFLVGSGGSILIEGKCQAKYGLTRFRLERGVETWTVDCTCGAKDDDGERMLACDTCSVWQHTRCLGIDSSNAIPSKFVCMRCTNSYQKTDYNSAKQSNSASLSSTSYCRGKAKAAATDACGLRLTSNLTVAFDVL
ncbi:hypothetical protein UlMin_043307 [Ulmus minor]